MTKQVSDCKGRDYWRGKKHSEATKKKMSLSHQKEKNPNWNGGVRHTKDGIFIHCPDHPRADNMGYVRRSNLMVEKVLGRHLKDNELVHHINFNHFDDRYENFLVCEFGYHTGLHNKIRHRGLKIEFESLEGGRI